MTEDLLTRARELAVYIIENRATIRQAAKHFGLSKSTVHKDLSERLPLANRALYLSVREILDQNRAERHIRGGVALLENVAAEKKEIAVSVDCPEDLTVSHDSKWTSEALFNLLDV